MVFQLHFFNSKNIFRTNINLFTKYLSENMENVTKDNFWLIYGLKLNKIFLHVLFDCSEVHFFNSKKKICPLCGHILIARFARKFERAQGARFDRRASRSVILDRRAARSGIFERRTSRSVLCSSHTFKFISYNLILKLKPT